MMPTEKTNLVMLTDTHVLIVRCLDVHTQFNLVKKLCCTDIVFAPPLHFFNLKHFVLLTIQHEALHHDRTSETKAEGFKQRNECTYFDIDIELILSFNGKWALLSHLGEMLKALQ